MAVEGDVAPADLLLAPWPQYEGAFDPSLWRPAIARQRIETKGGIAFEEGDLVAIQRKPDWLAGFGMGAVTAFSLRRRVHVEIPAAYFKFLSTAPAHAA